MRMYHPELDYTQKHGQEVSEAAFRLAWEPVGWLEWPPRKTKPDPDPIVEADDE